MIFSKLFGADIVVGVDIGSRFIKAAHAVNTSHNHWKVSHAASIATPIDAVKDGVVVDKGEVVKAIGELLGALGLSNATGAVCSVSGPGVVVRHLQLPKMSEDVLRGSIQYEAAKHLPTQVEDYVVEFEILGPSADNEDQMNVMLVAAPVLMINSRTEVLEKAKLEPISMELDAFAIQRALLDVPQTVPNGANTIGILTVGASLSELTIVVNGYFALLRSIPLGGEAITNAIMEQYKCSWRDAEQMKYGLNMASLLDQSASAEDVKLAKCGQPTLDEILREVRRSINFFRSQVNEGGYPLPKDAFENIDPSQPGGLGAVEKLVVTGGSSAMLGIERYMPARLGMSVETWNPFKNPVFDVSGVSESIRSAYFGGFTQCLGLAIKETFSTEDHIEKTNHDRAA